MSLRRICQAIKQDCHMKTIFRVLNLRLSSEAIDSRLGRVACDLGAAGVILASLVAFVRHPGSRADVGLGLVLACLVSLLLVVLGRLSPQVASSLEPIRARWPEFASYVACGGLLIVGIRWMADLRLTPGQVTVGLLLVSALSLATLVLGMTTTLVRIRRG
jgi:hypothetical protein